jgi:hypothetical protein
LPEVRSDSPVNLIADSLLSRQPWLKTAGVGHAYSFLVGGVDGVLQEAKSLDLGRPDVAAHAIIGGCPLHAQAVDQIRASLPGEAIDPAGREELIVHETGVDLLDFGDKSPVLAQRRLEIGLVGERS